MRRLKALALLALSPNIINLQTQSNGVQVYVDGKLIGTRAAINFTTATGMMTVCTDNPAAGRVDCAPSPNTVYLASKVTVQSGLITRCVSTNGTFGYTCGTCLDASGKPVLCGGGLNPIATAITPGMELAFVPDVPCLGTVGPNFPNCSLNVDNTGTISIRANDGSNNAVNISGNGHIIHRIVADLISTSLVWRLVY